MQKMKTRNFVIRCTLLGTEPVDDKPNTEYRRQADVRSVS